MQARRPSFYDLEDGLKHIWVMDTRELPNPVSISTFPVPKEADYARKGGHFGPHNLHENRPGSFVSSDLIFATYQNAGVRAFDISDPFCTLILRGIQNSLHSTSYQPIMMDANNDRKQLVKYLDLLMDRRVEGLAH